MIAHLPYECLASAFTVAPWLIGRRLLCVGTSKHSLTETNTYSDSSANTIDL